VNEIRKPRVELTSPEQLSKWGFKKEQFEKGAFEFHLALSLGPLAQERLLFLPGKVGSRSSGGIRIDGLLSHAFLKHYS